MTSMKRIMAFALAGITLTGCATTTEVTGPTVISYDHGALDTLLELGLEEKVVAIPHQSLPDYLADLGARLPDAGGLKTPDLALATDLKPGLVLMTGRQGAEALTSFAKAAPVRDVTLEGNDLQAAVNDRVLSLAGYYGLEEVAGVELDALWQHVEAQKATLADAGTVTVVTHNNGNFSLRQEALVYELLALTPAAVPDSVQPVVRGERTFYPVTADVLAQMAPDTLLVVDRSAAIGDEPLAPETLKASLAEAGVSTEVVVLNPGLWYLSGGGLQSVRLQVDEVVNAVR
ncbi:MAG: ABC transporter substrate-binding protein [Pseudomonadota bacterium]|nr:ABC transporter substrate-binding protein [Pseudomonadota bacterium]